MDFIKSIEQMREPTDRYNQVSAVCYYVLDNHAYYVALGNLPERCKATALRLFEESSTIGYHGQIVRKALKAYQSGETINEDQPPFEL